jgi:hypothetical protein
MTLTFEEISEQVRTLTIDERKKLINVIVESLVREAQSEKTHSILEFEGVGAHLWDGIDAQGYVNQLPSEWDDRP